MRFRIVIIEPPGYPHAAAFTEVAETLVHGLTALGHQASAVINGFDPDAVNVVLGMHMLPAPVVAQLPPETVMYNLEQVEDSMFQWAPQLREAFSRFEVWDYSQQNLVRLRAMNLAGRSHLLPIGMVPELCRIKSAPVQDIDVLFYGVVNERRRVALKSIQDRGHKVAAVFGAYGRERDGLIARAKLVLNLHKHEAQVFEVVRVSYLLANAKAVVAEVSAVTAIDDDLRGAVAATPYDGLAETCSRLLADEAGRKALEQRGFAAMNARRQSDYLAALLAER